MLDREYERFKNLVEGSSCIEELKRLIEITGLPISIDEEKKNSSIDIAKNIVKDSAEVSVSYGELERSMEDNANKLLDAIPRAYHHRSIGESTIERAMLSAFDYIRAECSKHGK